MEDVKGRIEILRDAVEMAYEQTDPSTNVLKIFNAPEFYFRGATGAYSFDSIVRREDDGDGFGAINEIGRELEAIVADVRFVDWLFVFGTVVAADTEYNGDEKKSSTSTLPLYTRGIILIQIILLASDSLPQSNSLVISTFLLQEMTSIQCQVGSGLAVMKSTRRINGEMLRNS